LGEWGRRKKRDTKKGKRGKMDRKKVKKAHFKRGLTGNHSKSNSRGEKGEKLEVTMGWEHWKIESSL